MNKLILSFSACLLFILASCKTENTTNPENPQTDDYTEIALAYGCAYGNAHEEQVGEQLFAFAIGDVQVDEKGEVTDNSNGYYLQLVMYADELTHDQLLKPGNYQVSPSVKAWKARRGYDVDPDHPGYAYGGSILYKVEDGFRTDAVKIKSGSVSLEGSADKANFVINVTGYDGNEYKYKSSGAVRMLDSLPAPDAFYNYEWDTVQQITVNADYAELTMFDSYGMFTLWLDDSKGGYSASLAAYYQSSGNKTVGTFPVGSDPYDETPGTTVYSRGCRNGNLYVSFVGVTEDGQNYDSDNYSLFFITGGTMTIDENDNVTATFTTYYGSTINVSFSGTFKRK